MRLKQKPPGAINSETPFHPQSHAAILAGSEDLMNLNPSWRNECEFGKPSLVPSDSIQSPEVSAGVRLKRAQRVQMTQYLIGSRRRSLRVPMGALGAVWMIIVAQGCSSDETDSGGGAAAPSVAGKASGAGTSGSGTAAGGNAGTAGKGTAGAGAGGAPSAGSGGSGVGATGGAVSGGSGGSSTAGSSSGGMTNAGAGGSTAGTGGATGGSGGGSALACDGPSNTTPCLASQAGGKCENADCGILRRGLRDCTCSGATLLFDCETCAFDCEAANLCAADPVLAKPPGGILDSSIPDCPVPVPGDGKSCGTFAEGYRCANKSDPTGPRNRLCGCGKRDGQIAWDCDSVPNFWR